MTARHKLNTAYLLGALIPAALLGASFSSWWVFFIVAGLLIAGAYYAGDIRLQSGGRR